MTSTQTADSATSGRPTWLVPALVVGAVVLAVVLALTQPWLLFVDEVADEQLTAASTSVSEADGASQSDTGDQTDMEEGDAAIAGALEENAQPAPDAQDGAEPSESDVPAEPSPTPSPTASPEPTGPVTLASGSFISRDHSTTGEVAIIEQEDGSRVLTIEDLQTDNGPDLFVYVDTDAADAAESAFDDGVNLGELRGNVGNLVYEIPDDLDLTDVGSVAIWCDRFSSLFGAADLTPA